LFGKYCRFRPKGTGTAKWQYLPVLRDLAAAERPVATERSVAAERPIAAEAESSTFFKYMFFAVAEVTTQLVPSVTKAFAAEGMAVFGMVVSTFAKSPVEVKVTLKLAAMMDASVFCKCRRCECR